MVYAITSNEIYSFFRSTPELNAIDKLVAVAIAVTPKKKISISTLAADLSVSRPTVIQALKRMRGKIVDWVGELGHENWYTIRPGNWLGQKTPTRQESLHPPGKNLYTPPAPIPPSPPGGGFKSFKSIKKEERGASATPPAPLSQISSAGKVGLSAEEKSDLEAIVVHHAKVCGFKTSNPPVLPAGDLCFELKSLFPRVGREAILDAILAHIEEEKQGKKSEKELLSSRFIKLEYIFRGEKINGKTTPGSVDMYRISELAARGRAIREQRERRAAPPPPAPIVRAEPEARRDPAVAGRWLEHLLGRRTRISATN